MPLNIPRLAADLTTRFKARWRTPEPATDENNDDYFLDGFALDIATAVINEIVNNAQCNGNDSGGDSHGSVGIV